MQVSGRTTRNLGFSFCENIDDLAPNFAYAVVCVCGVVTPTYDFLDRSM